MIDAEYATRLYLAVWQADGKNRKTYIEKMERTLQTLSEREQFALQCRYRDGMTYEQIGQQLGGITLETARHTLALTLMRMRAKSEIYINISKLLREIEDLKSRLEKQDAMLEEKEKLIIKQNLQMDFLNRQIEILLLQEADATNQETNQVSKTISDCNIMDMPFSMRTKNALKFSKISKVEDLFAIKNFNKIALLRNVGIVTILDIIHTMHEMGFQDWVQQALENTDRALRKKIQGGLK